MSVESTSELAGLSIGEFLDRVGARSPTPGGGAVTAVVAALAAALAQMVANYSIGRKDLAAQEPQVRQDIAKLERARALVLELGAEDMAAYELMNSAMRLPKDDPSREERLASAALVATRIPQALTAACCDVLRLFVEMTSRMNRNLRSDLAIAAVLAESAARASRWNIAVNLPLLPEAAGREILGQTDPLLRNAAELLRQVEAACA